MVYKVITDTWIRAGHPPKLYEYLALGSPRLLASIMALLLVMMGLGLWVLVPPHGGIGAAFAMLFAGCTAVPIRFAMTARRLEFGAATFAGTIWRLAGEPHGGETYLLPLGVAVFNRLRQRPA